MSVYHLACRWLDSAPTLDALRDYGACIASLRPRLSEAEQAMLRGAYEHNEGRLRGWI